MVEERLRAVIDFVWRPCTTRVRRHVRARARALVHTSAINDVDCVFPFTKVAYILTICSKMRRITQRLRAGNLSDSVSLAVDSAGASLLERSIRAIETSPVEDRRVHPRMHDPRAFTDRSRFKGGITR